MSNENKHDDGGAAFADPCGAHPGAHPPKEHKGMTLLDYMAGQLLATHPSRYLNGSWDIMAEECYGAAAAMIAEKRRREDGK